MAGRACWVPGASLAAMRGDPGALRCLGAGCWLSVLWMLANLRCRRSTCTFCPFLKQNARHLHSITQLKRPLGQVEVVDAGKSVLQVLHLHSHYVFRWLGNFQAISTTLWSI